MKVADITTPEVYKESYDFRWFLKWFEYALSKVEYDTQNLPDIYDPLRCPSDLLWMLADTMGFKYDDRVPMAFNRLVLVYFMSMIRNKGSKDGVTLAAETNLAQFNILEYGKENNILYERLEDTSIPVNSVYVTPHVEEGYIDVVYFSDKVPIDACIEYVRPLGMYVAQSAGVRFDARTKISIDARLTNINNLGMSIGPTHVGHYSRADYASIQRVDKSENDFISDSGQLQRRKLGRNIRVEYDYSPSSKLTRRERYQQQKENLEQSVSLDHVRQGVYYRNTKNEKVPTPNEDSPYINPGYRALFSLQLCNNEHIFKSLIDFKENEYETGMERKHIFGLGYFPTRQEVTTFNDNYVLPSLADYPRTWNLRYDKVRDQAVTTDTYTVDDGDSTHPHPAVNPIMARIGDSLSMNHMNTQYVMTTPDNSTKKIYPVVNKDIDYEHPITDADDVDDDYR